MKRAFVLAVLVAFAPAASAQQTVPAPPVTTGLIIGRAVDGGTGKPLAGVTVSLAGGGPGTVVGAGAGPIPRADATRVLTDAEGRFVFHDLAKGSFQVTATRPGYINGAYGQRTPANCCGRPLDLTEGEKKNDVVLALWKFASLGGTIVDESGEPMIGVQVRVLRRTMVAGRWQLTQTGNQPSTDDRGVYRIGTLVPGDYVLGVVSTLSTVPVSVYDAYARAANSGDFSRALDSSGGSVSLNGGVRVGAFMLQPGAQGPGGASASAPGIGPGSGRLLVYPSVYYPNAPTSSQATVVAVAPGEERSNIDFQLAPVPALRVSGTVTGPDGPSSQTGLQLLPAGIEGLQRDYSFETATAISDASGAFTFFGVQPGQYTLRVLRAPPRPVVATPGFSSVIQVGSTTIYSGGGSTYTTPPIPTEPTLWASLPVSVTDSDVTGLAVPLRNGARVTGRVEFVGAAEKPPADRLRQLSVSIESSDGRSAGSLSVSVQIRQAQINTQGLLNSYQLPAGRYLLRVPAGLSEWTFKSAMLNGKDVSNTPFEIGGEDITGVVLTFTDQVSDLSGTVHDDKGAADAAATVLLFPSDASSWTDYGIGARRFRSAAAGKDGAYRFVNVPDGEYAVVALHDEPPSDWQDPKVLQRFVGAASKVTFSTGDRKIQDLKSSVVR